MTVHVRGEVLLFRLLLPACLAGLALFFGCFEEEETIRFEPEIQARSLLVSEIEAAADRQTLLDCPVRFINDTSQPGTVRLTGTGCACYGVTWNGELITRDQELPLGAGETLLLQLEATPVASPSTRDYTALFSLQQGPDSPAQEQRVTCRLNIYKDLRMLPEILSLNRRAHEALTAVRTVTLEHVFRSADGNSREPEFHELPQFLRVVSMRSTGPAEPLEEDLWLKTWEATLEISIPAEWEPRSTRIPLNVSARSERDGRSAAHSGQLVLHNPQPLAFPSRVHFGRLTLLQPRQRKILVASKDQSAFTLRFDPEQLPPGVSLEIGQTAAERQWVEVTYTPQQEGHFTSSLNLLTDHPLIAGISIELQGLVAQAPPGN